MMLGKIVQKLNEVYIFDSLHQRLVFYSGLKCVYNKRLLSSSQFEKTPVETNTSVYDSIMNFVHPISSVLLAQKKYTAIIIWNMKLGIKQDDNFIEWETILNNLYKDNINIIKINYDSNQSYQEPYKHQISKMFNDFYSAYTGAVNSMNDK